MIDYMGILLWELKVDEQGRSLPPVSHLATGRQLKKQPARRQRLGRWLTGAINSILPTVVISDRQRTRAVEALLKEQNQRSVQP